MGSFDVSLSSTGTDLPIYFFTASITSVESSGNDLQFRSGGMKVPTPLLSEVIDLTTLRERLATYAIENFAVDDDLCPYFSQL